MLASVGVITFLTLTILFVFREQWNAILALLHQVSALKIILLAFFAQSYHLGEAAVGWTMFHTTTPGFRFHRSLTNTYLAVFGNTALFAVGTLPLQSYYLRECGIPPGVSIGTLTLQYAAHKMSVFLYAVCATICVTLTGHSFTHTAHTQHILTVAALVVTIVTSFLITLCISDRVRNLFLRFIGWLPDTAAWEKRKNSWRTQIEMLYQEAKHMLCSPARCAIILAENIAKLFVFYTLPFFCFHILNVFELSFWQVQCLSAWMMLLTGAIPNLAGMGSAEFSFLLLYTPFVGRPAAASALVLFRVATYYIPFLLGSCVFLYQQRNWRRK